MLTRRSVYPRTTNLSSEAFELATERVTEQIYIGQILMLDIFLTPVVLAGAIRLGCR